MPARPAVTGYNRAMRISLPSGTPAELALPDGTAVRGVVVIPDIFGLRPLFDGLVARLAREQSWAVAAIEPFPGQELASVDDRFGAVPHLVDSAVVGDAVAAAAELRKRSGATRVGVLGFCMGGMYTYKASGSGAFDRAVSFYGMIRIPVAWRGAGQGEPLQALTEPQACPLLAIVGGKDPYTPGDDVAALEATGPNIRVVTFPEADHGFVHDPDRPAHRPADAEAAWSQAVAFLS